MAGLALAEQARSVLAPAEVLVSQHPAEDGVDVVRESRRHPAQRQRRDRVLAQVSPQHVGVLGVGGERREGEQRPQHAVLGHHHEPVHVVVDDSDGVEFEEPFRHHERGLPRLADRPVPAVCRQRRVPPPPVVGVEPPFRLHRGQHQLVAAEEREELLPVPPHVLPALLDLLRVAEHQFRLPGRHLDREARDLPGVFPRVERLGARGEPRLVVVGQRKQGAGDEALLGRPPSEAVDPVVEVVDQVQHADRVVVGAADFEDSAHRVIGPAAEHLPVRPGQVPAGGDEPADRANAAGLRKRLPQRHAPLDQVHAENPSGRGAAPARIPYRRPSWAAIRMPRAR
jgi:hypothetical protein